MARSPLQVGAEMSDAIQAADTNRLRSLASAHSLDLAAFRGRANPLTDAASHNNIPALDVLVTERRWPLSLPGPSGQTALQLAVHRCHEQAEFWSLAHDAPVNQCDDHGNSPLHEALLVQAAPQIVHRLLDYGASLSFTNSKFNTPCIWRSSWTLMFSGVSWRARNAM